MQILLYDFRIMPFGLFEIEHKLVYNVNQEIKFEINNFHFTFSILNQQAITTGTSYTLLLIQLMKLYELK